MGESSNEADAAVCQDSKIGSCGRGRMQGLEGGKIARLKGWRV